MTDAQSTLGHQGYTLITDPGNDHVTVMWDEDGDRIERVGTWRTVEEAVADLDFLGWPTNVPQSVGRATTQVNDTLAHFAIAYREYTRLAMEIMAAMPPERFGDDVAALSKFHDDHLDKLKESSTELQMARMMAHRLAAVVGVLARIIGDGDIPDSAFAEACLTYDRGEQ